MAWVSCVSYPLAMQSIPMQMVLQLFVPFALSAVAIVLLLGLWNMARGNSPSLSQTLMRWRVGLQFAAVVIAMVLVYLLRA